MRRADASGMRCFRGSHAKSDGGMAIATVRTGRGSPGTGAGRRGTDEPRARAKNAKNEGRRIITLQAGLTPASRPESRRRGRAERQAPPEILGACRSAILALARAKRGQVSRVPAAAVSLRSGALTLQCSRLQVLAQQMTRPKSPSKSRHTEWIWLPLFCELSYSIRKVGPCTR